MKNLQKLFSMAMLVCMAVTMFSCSKDDEELGVEAGIVGKWKVTSTETIVNGMSADAFIKQLAEQTGVSEEEVRNNDYLDYENSNEDAGTIVEFSSDNSLIVKENDDEDNSEGTWRAGENRTVIMKFTNEYGSSEITYDVKSLKSNTATLSIKEERVVEFMEEEFEIEDEYLIHMKR